MEVSAGSGRSGERIRVGRAGGIGRSGCGVCLDSVHEMRTDVQWLGDCGWWRGRRSGWGLLGGWDGRSIFDLAGRGGHTRIDWWIERIADDVVEGLIGSYVDDLVERELVRSAGVERAFRGGCRGIGLWSGFGLGGVSTPVR